MAINRTLISPLDEIYIEGYILHRIITLKILKELPILNCVSPYKHCTKGQNLHFLTFRNIFVERDSHPRFC